MRESLLLIRKAIESDKSNVCETTPLLVAKRLAKEVTEIASGLHDNRPKFLKLLADPTIGTIIVEHWDRGTRFSWNYITTLMEEAHGRWIEAAFPDSAKDDLVNDFISIMTSMAARIYGRRGSKRRAERIKQCVEQVMKEQEPA